MKNLEVMAHAEELRLQQLLQMQFWHRRHSMDPNDESSGAFQSNNEALPYHWELTKGLRLHPWQEHCINSWFAAGRRGVMKVVTGAGKTILALAIAERLQQTQAPNLRVAVVVPTVVLL